MTRILDISPRVHAGIGVWPGDQAFEREVALSLEDGDALTLSAIRTTVHVGAHADAPNHYAKGGQGIGERPLAPYLGRCEVMHVDVARGARVGPQHLAGPVRAERVLFCTGTFPDPEEWNSDFASLSPELIHALADQGVVLVGIDTPSVDPEQSKDLPSHGALAARDLSVLEGLVLRDVPPGVYTLVALPWRLEGADASPVRAILVDDGGLAFSSVGADGR